MSLDSAPIEWGGILRFSKSVSWESILRSWVMLTPSSVGGHGGYPRAHYVSLVLTIIGDAEPPKVVHKIRTKQ